MRLKLGSLLCVLIILVFPSSLLAQKQTASPTPTSSKTTASTSKNVVKNFKANLNDYSPFGSNCNLKPKGDANCDGAVNDFDLSVWQVEFNAANSPKRSDFNNDGAVNLVDFGIWRGTVFPQRASLLDNLFGKLAGIFHFNATAQEISPTLPVLRYSDFFSSASDNNTIVSGLSTGNSQQVSFDAQGNPQNALYLDGNGQSLATASFLETGSTVISTQDSGIQINITKTAAGPIIENFKNPDGSLLALKSWPTQESYDRRDPPLSVTLPGQGATKQILNIQPNGDGIVEKLDAVGNVLSRSQLRANGTLVTDDLQNKTVTQSNSQIGFTTLSMKNNIGGNSQYMFYQGQLYAVVQTDSNKKAYVAKPLNSEGNSWSLATLEGGVKREERTITNPVTELKTGTPDPKQLVNMINYYKSASPNTQAVNFSDGFTSTAPGIRNPVQKANTILTISQAQAPAVLGIIKEARAQTSNHQDVPASQPGGNTVAVDTNSGQRGGQNTLEITIQSFPGGDGNRTPDSVVISLPAGSTVPDFSNADQVSAWANQVAGTPEARAASGASLYEISPASNVSGQPVGSLPTSLSTTTQPAEQPAAPVAPPAQPAAPAAPAAPATTTEALSQPCSGACDEVRQNLQNYRDQTAGGTTMSLQSWLDSQGVGGTERSNTVAAFEAQTSFINQAKQELSNMGIDPNIFNTFNAAGQSAGLLDAAMKSGLSYEQAKAIEQSVISGLPAEALTAGIGDQPPGLPGITQPNHVEGAASPGSPPSASAAAASVAPALPDRGSSVSLEGGRFTSTVTGYIDTQLNRPGLEGFASNIYDTNKLDANGNPSLVATQISDPTTGRSDWTDVATGNTYTSNSGVLTASTIDVSAEGSIVGISAVDGSLVAVGDSSYINSEGYVEGGRPATAEETAAFQADRQDQYNATGVEQYSESGAGTGGGSNCPGCQGSCFLAGTLISTPAGEKAIETLKSGDKVYSYSEKTGAKQVSDFKKLDINFVDEYLIINDKIHATVYHPFYIVIPNAAEGSVEDKTDSSSMTPLNDSTILKTVRADELKIGDTLLDENGNYVPVSSIEKVPAPKTTVYNLLSVSPNNNFFAEGILVHNYNDQSSSGSDTNGGGNDVSSEVSSSSSDSGGDQGGSSDGF